METYGTIRDEDLEVQDNKDPIENDVEAILPDVVDEYTAPDTY